MLAGPVPPEGVDAFNETPDTVLGTVINTVVKENLRTIYASFPQISVHAQVHYSDVPVVAPPQPARSILIFADTNNDGIPQAGENLPFGLGQQAIALPLNPKLVDAHDGQNFGLDYTLFNDDNGNDGQDGAEQTALRVAVLFFDAIDGADCDGAQTFEPALAQCVRIILDSDQVPDDTPGDPLLSRDFPAAPPAGEASVEFFDGFTPGADPASGTCSGASLGILNVPPQETDGAPEDPSAVRCLRVTVTAGDTTESQDVGVDEPPAAQIEVEFFTAYDPDAAACMGPSAGQVSVPPQDDDAQPPDVTLVRCVRVTITVGDESESQDVGVEDAPEADVLVTIEFFDGHDEATGACTGTSVGTVSVPPQMTDAPPEDAGTVRCIRVTVTASGEEVASQDVPVEQPADVSVNVSFYDSAADEDSCPATPPTAQVNVPPQAGDGLPTDPGSVACVRVTVSEGDETIATQDAVVPDAGAPDAEVAVEFFDASDADGACAGNPLGTVNVPPQMTDAPPEDPGAVRCVRVTATVDGEEVASQDVPVEGLPELPDLLVTIEFFPDFSPGAEPGTDTCEGTAVGQVSVPPQTTDAQPDPSEVRCVRITVTVDGEEVASQDFGLDLPPVPGAAVSVDFFDATDADGACAGNSLGTLSVPPQMTDAPPEDPGAVSCVRVTVTVDGEEVASQDVPVEGTDEVPDILVQVQFFDDFAPGADPTTGACAGDVIGQLSVPPQMGDGLPEDLGAVRCVRITVSVDGDEVASLDVGVPTAGAEVRLTTFPGFDLTEDPTTDPNPGACTGTANGQITIPPATGDAPPVDAGAVRCVRVSVTVEDVTQSSDLGVQEDAASIELTVDLFEGFLVPPSIMPAGDGPAPPEAPELPEAPPAPECDGEPSDTLVVSIPPAIEPPNPSVPALENVHCVRVSGSASVDLAAVEPVTIGPVDLGAIFANAEAILRFPTKTGDLLDADEVTEANVGDIRGACAGLNVQFGVDSFTFPPPGTELPAEPPVAAGPSVYLEDGLLCARQFLVAPGGEPTAVDTNEDGVPDTLEVVLVPENPDEPDEVLRIPLLTLLPTEDYDGDGFLNMDELAGATTLEQLAFAIFDPAMTLIDRDGDGTTDGEELAGGTDPDCWASTPNRPPVLGFPEEDVEGDEGDVVTFDVTASDEDYLDGQNDVLCIVGFSVIVGSGVLGAPDAMQPDIRTLHAEIAVGAQVPIEVTANPSLEIGAIFDTPILECPEDLPDGAACGPMKEASAGVTVEWDVPFTACPPNPGACIQLFEFTASDEDGAETTGAVPVSINHQRAPVGIAFSIGGVDELAPFEVDEAGSLTVDVSVDDVDGEDYTIEVDGIDESPCTFTQDDDASGTIECEPGFDVVDHDVPGVLTATFELVVTATNVDPDAGGDDHQITTADADVVVTDVNRAPTVDVDDAAETVANEGEDIAFAIEVADADGDVPTLTVNDDACNNSDALSDDDADGVWDLACEVGFDLVSHEDPDETTLDVTFTFTADDGWTLPEEGTDTLGVTVTDVNRAPTIVFEVDGEIVDAVIAPEGTTTEVRVIGADDDVGDTVTLVAGPLPAECSFAFDPGSVAVGTLSCDPDFDAIDHSDPDFTTLELDQAEFEADDGWLADLGTAAEALTVTVRDTNQAPVVTIDADAATDAEEGEAIAFDVTVTDADEDVAQLELVDESPCDPLTLEDDDADGIWTLICNISHDVVSHGASPPPTAELVLALEADDGWAPDPRVGSDSHTVTVTDVNRAPTIDVDPAAAQDADEGEQIVFDVTAADADGEVPTLTVEDGDACDALDLGANGDGTWTLDCTLSFDVAARGATETVTFAFEADDGWAPDPLNATEEHEVDVDFTNRLPTIGAIGTDAVGLVFVNGNAITFVLVGEDVVATAGVDDDDDDPLECTFDFGDGTDPVEVAAVAGVCNATHTYDLESPAGGFALNALVTDPDLALEDGVFAGPTLLNVLDPELDTDGDALTNGAELAGTTNGGVDLGFDPTDPYDSDTDGDLWTDGLEVDSTSDPNNVDSTPTDLDGDGVVNALDLAPRRAGPVWALVSVFDADGERLTPQEVALDPFKAARVCAYAAGDSLPFDGVPDAEPLGAFPGLCNDLAVPPIEPPPPPVDAAPSRT